MLSGPTIWRHVLAPRSRHRHAWRALRLPFAITALAIGASLAIPRLLACTCAGFSQSELMAVHTSSLAKRWRKLASPDVRCPSPESLFVHVDEHLDAWGHELRLLCEVSEPYRLVVISAGEDGAIGTPDDVIGTH